MEASNLMIYADDSRARGDRYPRPPASVEAAREPEENDASAPAGAQDELNRCEGPAPPEQTPEDPQELVQQELVRQESAQQELAQQELGGEVALHPPRPADRRAQEFLPQWLKRQGRAWPG